MEDQLHREGFGDALRRDVVMGRTDAAGGEDVVERAPHLVDRADNGVAIVGDHPHFLEADARLVQPLGEKGDVLVLHAP